MLDNNNEVKSISNNQNFTFEGMNKFNSLMKKSMFKMLSAYDAEGLILYPTNLEILNIEINNSDGCNNTGQHKIIFEYIPKLADHFNLPDHKLIKFKINNYKSKNNNCGLVCIIKALWKNANVIKPDILRKKYNIEKNALLIVEQLGLISTDYFNNNLMVVNNVGDELYNSNSEFENTIFLLLKDEHYFHIDTKIYKIYRKCETCNKTLRSNNLDHKCNMDNVEYFNAQIKKGHIGGAL